jgi:hypothetical protein
MRSCGVNARSGEGKTKASVPAVTCCFADLDLGGESIDKALAGLTSGSLPAPSFLVHSGYGLHAAWLLSEPSTSRARTGAGAGRDGHSPPGRVGQGAGERTFRSDEGGSLGQKPGTAMTFLEAQRAARRGNHRLVNAGRTP